MTRTNFRPIFPIAGMTFAYVTLWSLGHAQPPGYGENAAAIAGLIEQAAQSPTPRDAEGHPILSGYWEPPSGGPDPFGNSELRTNDEGAILVFPDFATVANVNALDVSNVERRWEDKSLRPRYKPEYQARADELFRAGDLNDPSYSCALPGVPRIGAPREIVQTLDAVYLLYEGEVNRFRVIPTDGRSHDPDRDPMANGDAVGSWDGDTLVVDVRNLAEDTWIDKDGSFHSPEMRVVERFTRKGNTLTYDVTVEDPYFAEPFNPKPTTLILAEQGTHLLQEWPCLEMSRDHMINSTKH